jgi:glycosyltransferase involved in cell wall biosynthesis
LKIALLTTDNREHYGDHAHPRPYFGAAPEALLEGFAALPELEVHVVSCLQRPVPSSAKIAPNIFYHSLVVSKPGWMRTLYAGCVLATRKKLHEIRPDIVHGQGTERDCALAAACSGYPNVVTIHGNMKAINQIYGHGFGSFHWLAAQLETFALKRTAGVFCNSAYTEGLVAPRARKIWRVPNALRTEFFSPAPERKTAARPVILNIGVIEPRKQQVELLEVARRLHERGLKFELQFIGKNTVASAYGDAFVKTLAAAEQAGYARQLGLLSSSQVMAAMDSAHALVHFPTEEAFGLVVAEALARNLKLFSATTGGVVDIAGGVADAELLPATDLASLESALARWLAAGTPASSNAAELMQSRYHPRVVARRHVEIYREVLDARAR